MTKQLVMVMSKPQRTDLGEILFRNLAKVPDNKAKSTLRPPPPSQTLTIAMTTLEMRMNCTLRGH